MVAFLVIVLDCWQQSRIRVRRVIIAFLGNLFA